MPLDRQELEQLAREAQQTYRDSGDEASFRTLNETLLELEAQGLRRPVRTCLEVRLPQVPQDALR